HRVLPESGDEIADGDSAGEGVGRLLPPPGAQLRGGGRAVQIAQDVDPGEAHPQSPQRGDQTGAGPAVPTRRTAAAPSRSARSPPRVPRCSADPATYGSSQAPGTSRHGPRSGVPSGEGQGGREYCVGSGWDDVLDF